MLPIRTRLPNTSVSSATPISTERCGGPDSAAGLVSSDMDYAPATPSRAPADRSAGVDFAPFLLFLRKEASLRHQFTVTLLFPGDPLGVLVAGHEGLVEGAVGHELLPLGRLAHLLEQLDIERDLVLGGARRHEDATQHQVFHVEALRDAGRDAVP